MFLKCVSIEAIDRTLHVAQMTNANVRLIIANTNANKCACTPMNICRKYYTHTCMHMHLHTGCMLIEWGFVQCVESDFVRLYFCFFLSVCASFSFYFVYLSSWAAPQAIIFLRKYVTVFKRKRKKALEISQLLIKWNKYEIQYKCVSFFAYVRASLSLKFEKKVLEKKQINIYNYNSIAYRLESKSNDWQDLLVGIFNLSRNFLSWVCFFFHFTCDSSYCYLLL